MSELLPDPLRWAKYFAAIKHGKNTYSTGLPYTHHLAAVEQVLRRFGYHDPQDLDLLEAAWLHDVVEDTGTKIREVREMFGWRVGDLVEAVTDGPGENRAAKHAATYPKIRQCPEATALKLADRIANVEQGAKTQMYLDEHEDFKRGLYVEGEYLPMWGHLDALFNAFRARSK